jgi:RimJ/RimL family protein N-acetyltransferase
MNSQLQKSPIEDPFITSFTTKKGTQIYTRLIHPNDAPLLIDLFNHLSIDTRRRRFNVGLANVEWERVQTTAQELANVDNQTQGGALLAFNESNELIGVARLARPVGDPAAPEAEVAVVVRDDYQNQGIGTTLTHLLVALARQMGIRTLTASVQADNAHIFAMLRKLPVPVRSRTSYGETEIAMEIDQEVSVK